MTKIIPKVAVVRSCDLNLEFGTLL